MYLSFALVVSVPLALVSWPALLGAYSLIQLMTIPNQKLQNGCQLSQRNWQGGWEKTGDRGQPLPRYSYAKIYAKICSSPNFPFSDFAAQDDFIYPVAINPNTSYWLCYDCFRSLFVVSSYQ